MVQEVIKSSSTSRLTIGFLTHSISDAYGELLWKGVMTAAAAADANLICFPGWAIYDQRGFNAQANVIYDLIDTNLLDGLIISGTLGNYVDRTGLQRFCEKYRPLPIASIAVDLDSIPSVLVENHQGMFDLVTHLIEVHGLSHFAFISGPDGNVEAATRYKAFVEALEKHNLPLRPHLVSPPTDWDEASGRNAMEVLLEERKLEPGKDFQAIVTSSDNVAYGALSVLWSRGISVPEDVILTGFDAQERSQYLTPSLTTVRQPIYEQAYRAAQMVLSQIRTGKIPDSMQLPTELIVRESCGCRNEELTRTKVASVDMPGKPPKMALAVSRETIFSKIDPVITAFSRSIDQEQAKKLTQAFYAEIREESQRNFLNILENSFKRAELVSEDIFTWQNVISILRRETLPFIDDKEALFHASERCHQALMMIGERAQRVQGYRRILSEERQATLDGINQGLLTTSDEKDLMKILVDGLPKLSVPSCYVSRYKNPVVPTNGSQLILAYRSGHVEAGELKEHLPARKLVPDNVLPKDRSYSLVVEPLYLRENQIGLAIFETGPREGIVYETLRGQLSGALWAARLGEYLRSLNEASSNIMSLREPKDILQAVVGRVCQAAGAKGANVVILDKDGLQRRLAIGGDLHSSKHSSILVGSVSMVSEVMKSDMPILIENLHKQSGPGIQQMIEQGIEAAGCFPLRLRDKAIGAMWVYYEKPHHFPHAEVNALRLYVNQAAIVYDNARRAKELEHLRQAAEKLTSAADVQKVLDQIAKSAREVLEADSAVIWSYDMARAAFVPNELAADGVAPHILKRYREDMPSPNGTAAVVMGRGYIAVSNVEDAKYSYLSSPARRLRQAIGVKSFQGIALEVNDETLGVLYVNHTEPRGFDQDDETTLKTFAYDAALALKKARLLERLQKGHEATRIIAEASVLKNLQGILNAIAKGTQDVLACDAVSLYTYDAGNDEIGFPPAMVGVKNTGAVLTFGMVNRDSLIRRVLEQDTLYVAQNASSDPVVSGPFVKREDIKSSVCIPLKVGASKVGVMFVNYRSLHYFINEELADIELFAHQAAVAIRNAQLYDDTEQGRTYLQTLYKAGNVVTSTLSLEEILNHIVEQASLLTSAVGGKRAHYCYLALMENDKLKFKATYSLLHPAEAVEHPYAIDLQHDEKIGIVGRTVASGEAQLVRDVTVDPDYRKDDEKTRSMLAVPIKLAKDILGVIVVAHPEFAAFDRNDLHALEALAAQAAIAIRNAQQYEELKRTQGLVGARTALAWMGMASTAWRHDITRDAQTIEDLIGLLRTDLEAIAASGRSSKISERLYKIQRLAIQIKERPTTLPLGTEEGAVSISLNGLIRERVKQLRERGELYETVKFQERLNAADDATVRASPGWLRRALDVVINNGIDAMADATDRQMTIETSRRDDQLVICISDTGKGIPEEVRSQLFYDPIKKTKGSKGLGMGLLMAQAIIQTYGGEIGVESSSPTGTTMFIRLPCEF